MSRLGPLFKVESFRQAVEEILVLDEDEFRARYEASVADISNTSTGEPIHSREEMLQRAFSLLYETAVRDGIDELEAELNEEFPEAPRESMARLVKTLTPDNEAQIRVASIDERDAFSPILTGHRMALDLRITDSNDGTALAMPFVSARLDFDATVIGGTNATLFQINLADIDELIAALISVRARAESVISGGSSISVPDWSHGLPRA